MTPRLPRHVSQQFPALVDAIHREPGDELVNVKRSDRWQDGWRCSLYLPQGWDRDPLLVSVVDKLSSPLEAFQAAVERLRKERAA